MRKNNLFHSLLLLSALVIGSCAKTTNTINNSQVIETPYSLYFTDTAGTLFNSTDGKTTKVVVAADGQPARCIFDLSGNLLTAKNSLYVSNNNGINFNASYPASFVQSIPRLNIRGRQFDLNQSMAISPTGWSNHAYIATRDPSPANYFGIAWNASGGTYGTWVLENYYDSPQVHHFGTLKVTSFTELENGTVVGYDGRNRGGFYRVNLNSKWQEMYNSSGDDPLAVPDSPSFFSLGHIKNRMILIDNYGLNGAKYSDDMGINWNSYPGLPLNTPLISISAPFEQTCLIGTDSAGLYKLNVNTDQFELVLNGLTANMIIRGITFKENIYKNGLHRQYIYLATNQGIYQSSDMGVNWTRTVPGNFVAIY